MRIFEAYANNNTQCSCCKKKIWKNKVIVIKYIKNKLIWLKCVDCYLGDNDE